jgi:hypothetical protein
MGRFTTVTGSEGEARLAPKQMEAVVTGESEIPRFSVISLSKYLASYSEMQGLSRTHFQKRESRFDKESRRLSQD